MRRVAKIAVVMTMAIAVAGAMASSASASLLYENWDGYALGRASPDLDGWEYVSDVASPPWYTLDNQNSAWIGNAKAGDASYPAAYSGEQFVDMNASYLWQNSGHTFAAGETYTLSVQATAAMSGERLYLYMADNNPSEGAELGTSLAMNYFDLPDTDYQWNDYSLSYTATAADAGKEIVFALYGRGATYVDDISLATSAIASTAPEPSSLALGVIGLAGLAFAGRWRKRRRAAS